MDDLSNMEKKMRLQRRIFLWSVLILGVIFLVLLPIISFLIGLFLTAVFGFRTRPADSLRPTRDLYPTLKEKLVVSKIAAEEYEKLEKVEEAEKKFVQENHKKKINKKELLKESTPTILGIGLFVVSFILLLMGFYGILVPKLG